MNNCTTCQYGQTSIQSTSNYLTKTTCNINNCNVEWIDSAQLKYKFGPDYCNGIRINRWFPLWLAETCPPETKPGDLGIPDPCDKTVYYKVIDGLIYRVKYCDGREVEREFIKDGLINDCYIRSIDASKITNVCALFRNSPPYHNGVVTDITDPTKGYLINTNAGKVPSPNFEFTDIVVTEDCKLKGVLPKKILRKNIYPDLACLGVRYNEASDTVSVNLADIVTGTPLEVVNSSGSCGKIRFKYLSTNTANLFEDSNGFRTSVRYQDSPTVVITENNNGIKADVKYQDTNTVDLSADNNGLKGDVKYQTTDSLILFANNNGLGGNVKIQDTDTVDLSINPNGIKADVKISNAAGNIISKDGNGLYAPNLAGIAVSLVGNNATIQTVAHSTLVSTLVTQIVNLGNISVPFAAPSGYKWVLQANFAGTIEALGNPVNFNQGTMAGFTGLVNSNNSISGSVKQGGLFGLPYFAIRSTCSASGVFDVNQSGSSSVSMLIEAINSGPGFFGNGTYHPQVEFTTLNMSGVLILVRT